MTSRWLLRYVFLIPNVDWLIIKIMKIKKNIVDEASQFFGIYLKLLFLVIY